MGGILTLILFLSLGIILVILTIGLVIAGLVELSSKGRGNSQEDISGTSFYDENKSFKLFKDPVEEVTTTSPNCDHYGSNTWSGAFEECSCIEIHYADSDK